MGKEMVPWGGRTEGQGSETERRVAGEKAALQGSCSLAATRPPHRPPAARTRCSRCMRPPTHQIREEGVAEEAGQALAALQRLAVQPHDCQGELWWGGAGGGRAGGS